MKKYGALILGLALSWQSVDAKTILISDIDDTIKNSHILDRSETAGNAFSTDNLLLGMNHAYQLLDRQYADRNEDLDIYYVSNAPPLVVGTNHIKFANRHGFPSADNEASFRFRSNIFDHEHKNNTIEAILQDTIVRKGENVDLIILVGDNGEKDILVYQKASAYIRKNFPNIKISTHIRMGYWTHSSEEKGLGTVEDQVGFATPLDLVLKWNQLGIIDGNQVSTNSDKQPDPSESLSSFINVFANALDSERPDQEDGELIFPEWVDCRDVNLTADLLLNVPADSIELTGQTLQKIATRCSEPGSEN